MSGSILTAGFGPIQLPVAGAGLLPGLKVRNLFGSALAAGQNDLYTVPANRRLYIQGFNAFQTAGATGSVTMQVKHGGTYYPLQAAMALTLNVGSTGTTTIGIVLDAGEILSAFTVGTTINVSVSGFEFDAVPGTLQSPKLYGLAAGPNLLYQCGAGKSAITLGPNAIMTGIVGVIINDASGPHSFNTFFVPAGGSGPDTAHQISATLPIAASTRGTLNIVTHFGAGDAFYITPSANSASQVAWFNIQEN